MNVISASRTRIDIRRNPPTGPDGARHRDAVDKIDLNATTIGRGTGPMHARLAAAIAVARYHGVDPDPRTARLDATEATPSSPVLVEWFRQSGLWARGMRLTFGQLMKIDSPAPISCCFPTGVPLW